MFENFSDSSRRLIYDAQNIARRMGHPKIGSGHLLLAILEDSAPGDLGRIMLEHFGVKPETVRERILNSLGRNEPPKFGSLRLSPDAEQMIYAGIKEWRASRCKQLYNHHLVLGALANDKWPAARLLRRDKVTLPAARRFVENATDNLSGKIKELLQEQACLTTRSKHE